MANGNMTGQGLLPGGMTGATPSALYGDQFRYLLSPLEQYQQYIQGQASRYAPTGDQPVFSPYLRQAMSRGFNPAYSMYQYYEPLGAYGTFADYLSAGEGALRPQPTGADVRELAMRAAGGAGGYSGFKQDAFTAASDPVRYEMFYGADDAVQRQRRLATLDALTNMGNIGTEGTTSRVYNPVLYGAAQSAIDNMYANYLSSGTQFGRMGPTGFLDYYLRERGQGARPTAQQQQVAAEMAAGGGM